MQFRVDRTGGIPAYVQLAGQVREALRLGWLKPGDRLPTVRDAVAASGVNPNTVLKAYRQLEFEGLVEARQGAGTFVKASLRSVDPEVMTDLRDHLAHWVLRAREAGMNDEGARALLGAVLDDKDTEGER
ncbi:GntR family transcriptional regulator [Solihabitans fulvus]|uniref:GntR family transcriptional regulator n=1 Tax=Solihabitans fulvus TaxID=1892852 RepID=A0A5B2WZF2_9PSEU|nr:GntR family transcriptional regulator [Solihabitans fulvus]KAA2256122.1 GntR family transcriptional regulator [Solihabitans fulvus]